MLRQAMLILGRGKDMSESDDEDSRRVWDQS